MKSSYFAINRLEFIVTYRCTGACHHCSLGDQLNRPGSVAPDPDLMADAVRQLAALTELSSVMTFGGEPLLYPDVTAAIHRAARDCGIPQRQLITNGFFSRDEDKINAVAANLAEAGVNDLLLSVDTFHQRTIPLEPVRQFAEALIRHQVPTRLQPAWLVTESAENAYNDETRGILGEFAPLHLPVGQGNDIFLSGNAIRYLADYYPPPQMDPEDRCGRMPYTDPLDHITSLSVEPDGAVTVCGFTLGNLHDASMAEIMENYDPYANPLMHALLTGGVPELLALAKAQGIAVHPESCHSICDLCRQVRIGMKD